MRSAFENYACQQHVGMCVAFNEKYKSVNFLKLNSRSPREPLPARNDDLL
jgi:hypothetical protein